MVIGLAVVYAFLPFKMHGSTFSDGDRAVAFRSESCGGAVLEAAQQKKLVMETADGDKRTVVSDVCSAASHDRLALSGLVLACGVVVLFVGLFWGRRQKEDASLPVP